MTSEEGTSYHYLPSAPFSAAPRELLALMDGAFDGLGIQLERGATWTTDAPFPGDGRGGGGARHPVSGGPG